MDLLELFPLFFRSGRAYIVNILQQYHDLLYAIIRIVSKDLSMAVENPIYLMESRMYAVEPRKVSFISNQIDSRFLRKCSSFSF